MVYLLMHCIAGSAALLWSSLAFFLFFFKYYLFCNTGCISVRASYEATTILFSTFFFLVLVILMIFIACYLFI
ncbi:hypothetical protein V8B55DRAFT_1505914 [Mucor lusitanicus]